MMSSPETNNLANDGDFNWETSSAVVLREQAAIAVYRDRRGDMVIRQRAAWNEASDLIVLIAPGNETIFLERAAEFLRKEPEGGR